jgi:parallel beta helix pectate lyase-like protein
MANYRAQVATVGRSATNAALLAVALFFGTGEMAGAAEHKISGQIETFDCSSIDPGETLTLASGARGPLTIRNCVGTQSNPIIVRNDSSGSGPTVIRRSSGSGGFMLNCNTCIGVVIDGSYKWRGAPTGKTYGIQLTITGGAGPSAYLRIGGLSRFVTVRNVEIDGKWPAIAKNGSGIRMNDLEVNRSAHPGLWREGIKIENNYVHDVALEGMYIGPSFKDGDLPLRDIEIRNNLVEDIGWEGINTKSMWAGDNRVHHNVVRRTGRNGVSSKPLQYSGISNNGGTVKIYNNWVETTGTHGIHVWTSNGPQESAGMGPFDAYIWNNVVVNAGGLWRSFMAKSYGINVGAENGVEKPVPHIYSNTIVSSRQGAVNMNRNVGKGFVRDNIAAGSGSNPVIDVPDFIDVVNNRAGSVSQIEFVDAGRQNFRLKVGSPARNAATNDFPPSDFADVTRPKDGAADQGAFEGGGS